MQSFFKIESKDSRYINKLQGLHGRTSSVQDRFSFDCHQDGHRCHTNRYQRWQVRPLLETSATIKNIDTKRKGFYALSPVRQVSAGTWTTKYNFVTTRTHFYDKYVVDSTVRIGILSSNNGLQPQKLFDWEWNCMPMNQLLNSDGSQVNWSSLVLTDSSSIWSHRYTQRRERWWEGSWHLCPQYVEEQVHQKSSSRWHEKVAPRVSHDK